MRLLYLIVMAIRKIFNLDGRRQMKGGDIMSPNVINWITNIVSFLLVILVPIKDYLATQPFDWFTFAICVLGAVVAYFTGKSTVYAMKRRGL